jgi:hypothetical protein
MKSDEQGTRARACLQWLVASIPLALGAVLTLANLRAGIHAWVMATLFLFGAVAVGGQLWSYTWFRAHHPEKPRLAILVGGAWLLVAALAFSWLMTLRRS